MARKFKDLVDGKGEAFVERVSSRTASMAKKVGGLDVTTFRVKRGGLEFRVTQDCGRGFRFGHFHWVLLSDAGDIMKTGQSMGLPPDILDDVSLDQLATRIFSDYDQEQEWKNNEWRKAKKVT
jgi:hypothetical protein